MVLTLYKLDASPPARAVTMVIEAANIPNVEYVDVNFLEKEHLKDNFLKMNPQHTVPTLQDDDFYVWDSHAIAVYLLTKYSKNTTLYPSDPKQRAIIDQRLHFDSGILFPSLRGAIEPVVYRGAKAIKPEALEKIKSGYDFSEKFLTKRWFAGDELTLADIFFMASISSLNEILPIDAAAYPKLTEWLNRCKELDYYKKMNEPGSIQLGNLVKSKLGSHIVSGITRTTASFQLNNLKKRIMVLKLYKMDASTPARALMMTIEAAKIPNIEFIEVNLAEGEHLNDEFVKMNPQHTVPTLQDDDFYLWDSHAIAVYLLTKYSNNTTLYPSDPKKRAIIDQRLYFDCGILFTSLRGAVEPIVYKNEGAFRPEDLEKMRSAYDLSEKFLTKRWVAGDEFSLADIFFMASIGTMEELLPIDPTTYPRITEWLNRCKELDYYKKKNVPGLKKLVDIIKSRLA
ncbi:PREDICTED: uncharacterized protein LOC106104050 [Papilio polytes]|uniref:uncharacterized protein LOC106104050 n=1 Tax=Papilio polytes TaxID=76194 RepID=UPI00067602F8|nr:PREDICTED: uncharacterized protein LOC106104050 [Papilio polytes]